MRNKILFILMIATGTLFGQKTKPGILVRSYDTSSDPAAFTLTKDERVRNIRKNHDLSVYFERKTKLGDGREYLLKYHVRGANLGIEDDSLAIKSPLVYIHDKYKRNTDSIYDYFNNTKSGVSKMSVNNITKIYYERSQLKKVTAGIAATSLIAAFVVAPLTALEDGVLNLDKFRKINRPALGVFVGSVTIGIVFSQKRFLLKTDKTGSKTWTLRKGK